MTREERLELLKQIEKDIHVCTLESTLLDDAKSCAIHSVIEELEQETTTRNDLGVDCIDRTQAIERLKLQNFPISEGADNSRDRHRYMQAMADIQAIRELPSVTPQEPKIVPIAEIKLDEDKLKSRIVTDLYSVIKQNYIEREVLDKIRAEINAISPEPTEYDIVDGNPKKYAVWETIADVLKIIDKYRAESEGNNV